MRLTSLTLAATLAATARAVTVGWYEGADCTGQLYYSDTDVDVGYCYWYSGLPVSSHKSIKFADVPHQIYAFKSGGPNDKCSNGHQASGTGSGCLTAPDGVNWESFTVTGS